MTPRRRRAALRIDVLTLFPRMFEGVFSQSILKRAVEKGLLDVRCEDLRGYAQDRRGTVDDRPYGGGAGMVLIAPVLERALRKLRRKGSKVLLLSPQGRRFDQRAAQELSREKHLVLVCGHYEGVDERIMDFVDGELSMGDFVLTGGEIPAMAVVDAVTRLLPGVLAKPEAAQKESFSEELLDYPQYTRPRVWKGREVPEVLLGGDHARIEEWRRQAALAATRRKRPDLLSARPTALEKKRKKKI
ncbi:MAG: tRNA (guanosine(37)-N1)-methyltransferase TrmD [Elusimicrobiota bacterium]